LSLAAALYARLSTFPGLTALVGPRVYPVEAPQETARPYVVFLTVSTQRLNHLGGPSEVAQARIQIDAYATSYAAAVAIGTQIRAALDQLTGVWGGVDVLSALSLDAREFYEDAANPPLYRLSQDFSVWHRT
jgi:hypothetical protein